MYCTFNAFHNSTLIIIHFLFYVLSVSQGYRIFTFKFPYTLFRVARAQNQPSTTKTTENKKSAPKWEGGLSLSPLPHNKMSPIYCSIGYLLLSSYILYSSCLSPKSAFYNNKNEICPHAKRGATPHLP